MKNKYVIIALFFMNVICIAMMIICFIVKNNNSLNANNIFNKDIKYIVEVKGSCDDGETYGTGVLIQEKGNIITNAHVITYKNLGETKVFEKLEIRFNNEDDYYEVSLIKYDLELDLAYLKIKDYNRKKYISLGSEKYSFGDKVYAIGNTSNYGLGISEGIISVPEVNIIHDGVSRNVIQADINISSGNSGGALLDKKGNLIGITTFRTKDLNNNINYGFVYCIPIKEIKKFINWE